MKPRGRVESVLTRAVLAALLLLAAPGVAAVSLESAGEAYRLGDYATAAAEFRELAGRGVPRAQAILGLMYLYGEGVAPDLETAFGWYRRAAEAGYGPAQYRLAEMYATGEGVDADPARAREWLERAADNGNARARRAIEIGAAWVPDTAPRPLAEAAPGRDAVPDDAPPAERLIASARRSLRDQARIGFGLSAATAVPRLRLSIALQPRRRPGTRTRHILEPAREGPRPALRWSVALGR